MLPKKGLIIAKYYGVFSFQFDETQCSVNGKLLFAVGNPICPWDHFWAKIQKYSKKVFCFNFGPYMAPKI